jgi:ribosomal protein L16 Arg81 hydroxylase
MTLSQLINPLAVDQFLGAYWTRRAAHVPGSPEKFANLFAWSDLNDMLGREVDSGRVRCSRDGAIVPESEFAEIGVQTGKIRVVPAKLLALLRNRTSLVVNSVHAQLASVQRLQSGLAADFGEKVHVNAYGSWPGSEGFGLHFDGHEVFVIQIAGAKRWVILPPTLESPLGGSESEGVKDTPPPLSEQYLTVDLRVGDVLYVPKGHWHRTEAIDGPSLHLTIGISVRNGFAVLQALQRRLQTMALWRRDLPLAFGALASPQAVLDLETRLRDLAASVHDVMSGDGLAPALVEQERRAQQRLPLSLPAQVDASKSVVDAHRVAVTPLGRHVAVAAAGAPATLLNGIYTGPSAELVNAMLRGESFSFGDLGVLAPELDSTVVRRIVADLVESGLVSVGAGE